MINYIKRLNLELKKGTKKVITETYNELLMNKICNFDNTSKLFLYNKLKSDIKPAEYLKCANSNSRKILTKFRISDHNLEVELGRYKNIPRELRHCKICKVLDDERHFFFNCQINNSLRTRFLNLISNNNPDFKQLDPLNKIVYLLNSDMDVLPIVVDFIKQSLELRK